MPIEFYSVGDAYGCFSNFSAHPITLAGKRWPTTEHYFQAQKFVGTDDAYVEEIRSARSPMIAARLGRSRKHPLRRDWESVKDEVMRQAVLAKFETHPDAREVLLSTGDEQLIEKTTDDHYWGCGSTGTGKNRLGQLLVEVRAILRGRAQPSR
ncbi:NADAR family protein [Myxococcaceae bacterium GXIMD 01537]